jgi:hypothetical protein
VLQVEVRRKLPGTLAVRIFTRLPVARVLGTSGLLVDDTGTVLALPDTRKNKSLVEALPALAGLPGAKQLQAGNRLDDELVRAALAFLRYRITVPKAAWFVPSMVQVDAVHQQLRIYLKPNPRALIGSDAVLMLPAKGMDAAFSRALDVVADRAAAHQPSREIDAWTSPDKVYVTP